MLYEVQKGDLTRAGIILADAFQHDPVWNRVFEGESHYGKKYRAFFESPVRYCLKFGEVYAPSENLEGIVAWVPGKYADMNAWRGIRSGSVSAMMRIGFNTMKKMMPIIKPLTEDRHRHMAGCTYMYVIIVGVATDLQGKGFGRKLIGAAIEKSQSLGVQLYLETETEENVKMYEHFGFKLLEEITLPVIDLPMWEMVWKPQV
ncbi:GNAT family N-acetyltransferase [Chloroflexota bacterium]